MIPFLAPFSKLTPDNLVWVTLIRLGLALLCGAIIGCASVFFALAVWCGSGPPASAAMNRREAEKSKALSPQLFKCYLLAYKHS